MNPILLALLIGLLIGVLLSFKLFSRPLERRRIMSYDFPEGWWQLLYDKLPISFEMEGKARQKLAKEIQWALADKDFFSLGEKELEARECILICAPFILFELHSSGRPLKGLKRFLIRDETVPKEQEFKEDPHDFTLGLDHLTSRVYCASKNELKVSTKKVLTQIFGEKRLASFDRPAILKNYTSRFQSSRLSHAPNALLATLKDEFYLSSELDEEEVIWKIHEIFCYSPHEVKKALPKTYQGLLSYYELAQEA